MKLKFLIEIEFDDEDNVDADLIRAEIVESMPVFFGVDNPVFWSALAVSSIE